MRGVPRRHAPGAAPAPVGDAPPSRRTVHRYLVHARTELAKRGARAAHMGDRLLGLQLARLDVAFRVASRQRNPTAMLRVVALTCELFDLNGAVRPQLSALAGSGLRGGHQPATTQEDERDPLPAASMIEETAVHELAALWARARERLPAIRDGAPAREIS